MAKPGQAPRQKEAASGGKAASTVSETAGSIVRRSAEATSSIAVSGEKLWARRRACTSFAICGRSMKGSCYAAGFQSATKIARSTGGSVSAKRNASVTLSRRRKT
jgi:hypothetical protein